MSYFHNYIFAIFIPFVVVNHVGTVRQFWVNFLLTIVFWVPGVLHAWYVVWLQHHEVEPEKSVILYHLTVFVGKCVLMTNFYQGMNRWTDGLFVKLHDRNVYDRETIDDLIQLRNITMALTLIIWLGLLRMCYHTYKKIAIHRGYIIYEMSMICVSILIVTSSLRNLVSNGDLESIWTEGFGILVYGGVMIYYARDVYLGTEEKKEEVILKSEKVKDLV